jgi:hypothetical protein
MGFLLTLLKPVESNLNMNYLIDITQATKSEILAKYGFLNLAKSYSKSKLIEQINLYHLKLKLEIKLPVHSQIELPRNYILNIQTSRTYRVEDYSIYGLNSITASIHLVLLDDPSNEFINIPIPYSLIESGKPTELFAYLLNLKQIKFDFSAQSSSKTWDEQNPELIKESKANYDIKRPVWSFRPERELIEWLEEERWDDNDGTPETNAQLLTRKLTKLMKLEQQGF